MKSKKTREKILDESLKLFNLKKSSNVSTVQISTAMNISPGNLYYYFANKEEVIRCIWNERMKSEVDSLVHTANELKTSDELLDLLDECFSHFEKFRFFYTELSTLFINDNLMEKIYMEKLEEIVNCLINAYTAWENSDSLIKLDDRQKYYFALNLLKLLNSSFVYYDSEHVRAEGVDNFVMSQIKHVLAYIEVYFQADARNTFIKLMVDKGIY